MCLNFFKIVKFGSTPNNQSIQKDCEAPTLPEVFVFSYSGPHFPTLLRISPYSVRTRENTDQNNYE